MLRISAAVMLFYTTKTGIGAMAGADSEKLIRQYAAGEITWSALRTRGFDSYLDVLAQLGKLGLRPPIAPMEGPNVEARQRGRALLRQALKDAKP